MSNSRRTLAESAMWSVVGAGSVRHDSLAATSAPIRARSGFTRYATWDKYAIPLIRADGRDLD
jgi:hypothetical protein